jgi:hypothetical protein
VSAPTTSRPRLFDEPVYTGQCLTCAREFDLDDGVLAEHRVPAVHGRPRPRCPGTGYPPVAGSVEEVPWFPQEGPCWLEEPLPAGDSDADSCEAA